MYDISEKSLSKVSLLSFLRDHEILNDTIKQEIIKTLSDRRGGGFDHAKNFLRKGIKKQIDGALYQESLLNFLNNLKTNNY